VICQSTPLNRDFIISQKRKNTTFFQDIRKKSTQKGAFSFVQCYTKINSKLHKKGVISLARMNNPRGFLTDQEKENLPTVTWPLIRRILGYLAPYWTRFVLVFVTILLSSVLGLLPSIITGRIVDEALVGESMTLLIRLLLAALALSIYNLLQRKLTQTYTAVQTSAYSIFGGTLLLAVFVPAAVQEISAAPPIQFFYLAVLGIGSSAISYVAWAKAFSKANQTSQVTNYMFVTPFLTSILAFFFAGEVPDTATLIGGSIIMAGLVLFNFGNKLCTQSLRHDT
jgi:uncharacterized membrane protein